MHLKREPNVGDFDALYAAVIEAHSDLSESESAALNARLVLLLANHIGDEAVLREAITRGARVDREQVALPPVIPESAQQISGTRDALQVRGPGSARCAGRDDG